MVRTARLWCLHSMELKGVDSYTDLVRASSKVKQFCSPAMAESVFRSNKSTAKKFEKRWIKNVKKNLPLFHKHGSFKEAFGGFGHQKAVIGIGAGPSFNRNKDILKQVYQNNLLFPTDKQPFILFASNKQLKPLLKMGIYPHFTMLVDSGDVLLPQFQKIPKWARKSILVAGINTSHKILKHWDEQGGQICFFCIQGGDDQKWLKENTDIDTEFMQLVQGGNVLNTMWTASLSILGSDVFMLVGNDLAFKYTEDAQERAKSFYADGDYRLNILNKKNEADDKLVYPAFNIFESAIQQGRYGVNFELACMSKQMWIYKTYLEVQATLWEDNTQYFFYNCSEYGTLGVMMRNFGVAHVHERDNWYLIDELLPKRWLTTTLENAVKQFMEAKRCLIQEATRRVAESAIVSPVRTGIVKPIGHKDLRQTASGIII